MKQAAVLFDLDGVVIDTRRATAAALANIASEALHRKVTDDELAPYVTQPPPKALAAVGVVDAHLACERGLDRALADATQDLRVFDSVVKGIRALVEAGAQVGIVTSQPRRRLQAMIPPEVAAHVAVVIAREDARPKPAPDGILLALRRLRVRRSQALYLGDTPDDLLAARGAGVTSVGCTWGFAEESQLRRFTPDIVLTEPATVGPDLLQLLPDFNPTDLS